MKPDACVFEGGLPEANGPAGAGEVPTWPDLLVASHDLYWETDAHHCWAVLEGIGASSGVRQRCLGTCAWEPPTFSPAASQGVALQQAMTQHEVVHRLEVACPQPDGSLQWFALNGMPRHDPTQGFVGYVGTGTDITAIKGSHRLLTREALAEVQLEQAHEALARSEQHLRALFDAMPERLWLKSTAGVFMACNSPAATAFGLTVSDLVGRTELELVPGTGLMPGHLDTDLRALRTHAPVVFEQALPGVPGGPADRLFEVVKRAVFDGHGQPIGVLGMARDVTERRRAEDQIQQLAFYDSLTGLCNRQHFHERLIRAQISSVRSLQWAAVCFIDLDNFKDLNDTQGHDQGDLLLQQVGQRLLASVRGQDTVGRLGGDEFVVLLEGLDTDHDQAALSANVVGEKLRQTLNQPYPLRAGLHSNSPSIGITLFRDHEESVDDILKRADLAMYQSKASGRNLVRFFDPQMQTVVMERTALERDLREALAGEQLLLYFQPVVNVAAETTGFEALVRWRHPVRGLVSPADFIPLAERTDLILPIGEWVLLTACQQLARWANDPATAHWTLAVNLSARQLRQPDFVQRVQDVLARTAAPPTRLKLELTESLLLHDVNETIAKMDELARWGVRFSLDDFGTGYSSLSYLKRLPLTVLKIDQSFVRDLLTDLNDAAIARAILQLARSLDLKVVAEGVETEGQKNMLEIMGCQAFQGYLFGRPEPMKDAP